MAEYYKLQTARSSDLCNAFETYADNHLDTYVAEWTPVNKYVCAGEQQLLDAECTTVAVTALKEVIGYHGLCIIVLSNTASVLKDSTDALWIEAKLAEQLELVLK